MRLSAGPCSSSLWTASPPTSAKSLLRGLWSRSPFETSPSNSGAVKVPSSNCNSALCRHCAQRLGAPMSEQILFEDLARPLDALFAGADAPACSAEVAELAAMAADLR